MRGIDKQQVLERAKALCERDGVPWYEPVATRGQNPDIQPVRLRERERYLARAEMELRQEEMARKADRRVRSKPIKP